MRNGREMRWLWRRVDRKGACGHVRGKQLEAFFSDMASCCVVLHQRTAGRARTGVCLSSVRLNSSRLRLRGPKCVKKVSPASLQRQQQQPDERQDRAAPSCSVGDRDHSSLAAHHGRPMGVVASACPSFLRWMSTSRITYFMWVADETSARARTSAQERSDGLASSSGCCLLCSWAGAQHFYPFNQKSWESRLAIAVFRSLNCIVKALKV